MLFNCVLVEISPEYPLEGLILKLKLQYFWPTQYLLWDLILPLSSLSFQALLSQRGCCSASGYQSEFCFAVGQDINIKKKYFLSTKLSSM